MSRSHGNKILALGEGQGTGSGKIAPISIVTKDDHG